MAGAGGFEPPNTGTKNRRLNHLATPHSLAGIAENISAIGWGRKPGLAGQSKPPAGGRQGTIWGNVRTQRFFSTQTSTITFKSALASVSRFFKKWPRDVPGRGLTSSKSQRRRAAVPRAPTKRGGPGPAPPLPRPPRRPRVPGRHPRRAAVLVRRGAGLRRLHCFQRLSGEVLTLWSPLE